MKFLIIPDVHNRTPKLKKLLAKHARNFDQIIQLGDWLDNFGDNAEVVSSVAVDMNFIVNTYPMTLLWGNHDLPYRFPSKYTWCPGWSLDKMKAVVGTLDKSIWKMFRVYVELDGYVLSHAGFHPETKALIHNCGGFEEALTAGLKDSIISIGLPRGGNDKLGGPLWLDWDHEFVDIDDLPQIVGHTPHKQPQWKGKSLCLDTHLNHYATLIDGKLSVWRWEDDPQL